MSALRGAVKVIVGLALLLGLLWLVRSLDDHGGVGGLGDNGGVDGGED